MITKQTGGKPEDPLDSQPEKATPHRFPRRPKILIIDDEISATRLLKLNLEQTGQYAVRTENVSGAAFAAAIEFEPDLIFLDIIMPGIDGGELAAIMRADSRLASTPIVFLTAVATKSDIQKNGGSIGGMAFLAKPAAVAEVLSCLNENLQKSDRFESHS